MKKSTKDIVTIAILISLCVVLSLVDRFISFSIISLVPYLGVIVPNFKMGLANIVIVVIIYVYGEKIGILAALLKVILVGLFNFGGIPMSFGGTFFSVLSMITLKKLIKNEKLIPFISGVGGFAHSFGQLLFGFLYYGLIDINSTLINKKPDLNFLIYSPGILIMGLITGFIIGVLSKRIIYIYLINKGVKK